MNIISVLNDWKRSPIVKIVARGCVLKACSRAKKGTALPVESLRGK